MPYAIEIPHTGAEEVLTKVAHLPQSPKPNEVLIRNHTAAVNYIDTIIRRSEMPEGMMPNLPHVPGVEGAGVVEAIDEEVTQIAVGDRVA